MRNRLPAPTPVVLVKMIDGRTIEGSHALMTIGSVLNTGCLDLDRVGLELGRGNYLTVDRVSRTSVPGIYASGGLHRPVAAGVGDGDAGSDRDVPRVG